MELPRSAIHSRGAGLNEWRRFIVSLTYPLRIQEPIPRDN